RRQGVVRSRRLQGGRAAQADTADRQEGAAARALKEARMTSEHNATQIAEWNGVLGERWAAMQRETDGVVLPFGEAALAAAAPAIGERVVDVGCGCGETTIELARRVGQNGAVLGVDVSRPMLDVARRHPAVAGLPQLEYRECDASTANLPAPLD